MKLRLPCPVTLAVAAFLGGLPALAAQPTGENRSDASPTAKSVTVFPIVLNSGKPIPGVPADMSKTAAELVGLFLEVGGIKDVEIGDTAFSPPDNADLTGVAEAFGRFVLSQKLNSEYALYGQFFGTPGKGVDEIRLIAVDRQGKVLLSDRLDRQQLALKRAVSVVERVDPMLASYYLVYELRGLWGLADLNRKDAPKGKMARLWAEKSGLPPESEQEAMKSRLDALKRTIKTSTVAVFPVLVSARGDAQLAGRLAEMLTGEGLGRAGPASANPNLEVKPNTNQLRIAWDSARVFREFLRKNPPAADYALLAAYGIGRTADGKTGVAGIQLIVCDRNGDWGLVTLRNSDHADFQQINPQSPEDCNRLVVEVLKNELR